MHDTAFYIKQQYNCHLRLGLSKIRLSSHEFFVERGGWSKPKVEYINRLCALCDNGDEYLILITCPLYLDLRGKFIKKQYYGISSELLKLITGDISKCITLIINQSLHSGIFPDKLKIAKVTPIHKKGDIKLITNFRPISVLPVISKIFETVICDQLSHYLESNNLLCPQQYGFTKNSSTEIAALEVIDRLLNQLNNTTKYLKVI